MKSKIILFMFIFFTCFSFTFANQTPTINSKSAIAIDADSSIVLYNKNINKKIYPASTTKILTAILAIENLSLDKNIVVSKTAIDIPWDSSSVYLKKDEIISVNDLLYCLLLNSGNDAANALAEAVSGDTTSFVELMNSKAKELGCESTHFNNAHGYSDDKHYTTALDMAKIFNYCIQNETFCKIISTKSYIVDKTNKTSEKRYLYNTNRLILQKEDSIYARYYEHCMGGKTGYTDEAGRTLITYAKKEDKTIIVAVFGASSSGSVDVRYTEAINLFEYSFNNFHKYTLAKKENYNFNYINIENKLQYLVGLNENVEILLSKDIMPNVSYSLKIDEDILHKQDSNATNQLPAGKIIFKLDFESGDYQIIEQPIYVKNISKYNNTSALQVINYTAVIIVFIILIIGVLVCIIPKRKNKIAINKTSRKSRRR